MLAAVLNPETGDLMIVNAGHMAPILRQQDGSVTEIGEEAAGLPLGVAAGMEYESYAHRLEPGDVVTIFTDGFSEAMNSERELYGLERLNKEISSPDSTSAIRQAHPRRRQNSSAVTTKATTCAWPA